MFYSQFILAKKGPLGTIWIAAHLERKLRKNQVADTDIGVSVDSILFPEVPIALRLSSHLLLGVVRIYSRKVNYLFHDCSEALLKIKQAFRSAAVDLPPEESTAPYHSITLPETFHLDDFELPDTAFPGDFVDHHISAKEHITLQDNLEGTGYPTSQFGLDERFGDGNASHIGLDLDEDLFFDKNHASQHASIRLGSDDGAFQGESSIPPTDMDIDEDQSGFIKDRSAGSSKSLFGLSSYEKGYSSMEDLKRNDDPPNWHGYNIQTPDLNEAFFSNNNIEGPPICDQSAANGVLSSELIEYAHAPSTPGLMEETIPANVPESPALSPRGKTSPSIIDGAIKADNAINSSLQDALPDSTIENHVVKDAVTNDPESANVVHVPSPATAFIENELPTSAENNTVCNGLEGMVPEEAPADNSVLDAKVIKSPSRLPTDSLPESGVTEAMSSKSVKDKAGPSVLDNQDPTEEGVNHSDIHLKPCTMGSNKALSVDDTTLSENVSDFIPKESEEPLVRVNLEHASVSPSEMQGGDPCAADATNANEDAHQNSDNLLRKDVSNADKQIELSTSEFPEPEKMLFAASVDIDQANELGQITSEKGITESDGSVNKMSSLSGRKRRLVDSTLLLENGSTGKTTSKPRFKRNIDYIPDDDDLLASILVGKRTPGLRIEPTPPLSKGPLKRPRLTPKIGIPKRKVLLDDAMFLHADAIRQQLINTEDIRRIRKKAPCTRPEIWMIEKSSLEDEIFNDSILSGASAELNNLQSRTYDIETNGLIGLSNEPDIVRNSDFESGGKEITAQSSEMPNKISEEVQETSTALEVHDSKTVGTSERQEHSGSLQLELQNENQLNAVSMMEIDNEERIAANGMSIPSTEQGDELGTLGGCRADVSLIDNNASSERSELIQPSVDLPEMKGTSDGNDAADALIVEGNGSTVDILLFNGPQDIHADLDKGVSGETSVGVLDPAAEAGLPIECPTMMRDEISSFTNVVAECFVPGDLGVRMDMNDDSDMPKGILSREVSDSKENNNSQITGTGSIPAAGDENVASTVGENSGLQENNPEGGIDMESTGIDFVPKECSDFCSAIGGVNTEFLNVDDEADYDEEANGDVPNPEELNSFESGWSSRTRGVARYLKTLFDEESGHGRKSVAMDHLLSGKTRKEASRLFFETLVLKTRDYIHVEQPHPFELINVKPKVKLMKSEF
ncbi:sister chromatid cohesion 1 protein 4 [Typha angustifolia]|uniref:sister chromatid cohesion 1 protein 4 n=1 Tax=Typha angustifolia TaxID=59011 RepID=UPI003C2E916B